MPTVEKVKAGIKGTNELDTNARQAGAFWQLREMMYSFAYSQHRTDRQFTPDERRRVGEFYTSYYQTWQLVQQALGQDRAQLFKLQGYTVDPALKSEILDKLCAASLSHSVPESNRRATRAHQGAAGSRSLSRQAG
jgi:hypothetical protein